VQQRARAPDRAGARKKQTLLPALMENAEINVLLFLILMEKEDTIKIMEKETAMKKILSRVLFYTEKLFKSLSAFCKMATKKKRQNYCVHNLAFPRILQSIPL
jgi:hypothetical protein